WGGWGGGGGCRGRGLGGGGGGDRRARPRPGLRAWPGFAGVPAGRPPPEGAGLQVPQRQRRLRRVPFLKPPLIRSAPMRILMIGHSSVGKTTFMASTYGAMQAGVNGFTLRAAEPRAHDQLVPLHGEGRRGRYPAPTDQRAEYKFQLRHDGKGCFEFTWVDFRGGAIAERSSSREAAKLVEDLKACDGTLLFFDAAAAARGDEDANEIGRVSVLLGQAIAARQRPMPVGLVFTKADLVKDHHRVR